MMKKLLLGVAFSAMAAPVCAAGLPQLNSLNLSSLGAAPKAGTGSATSTGTGTGTGTGMGGASAAPGLGSLPLPPAVVDLGLSTPGFGSAAHSAPPATTLPGLADIIPYYDNTGTGGRMNTDVEVDTYGQQGQAPLNVYGLVFTDPPQHPLHLVGDLAGIPVNVPVDAPAQ